MDMLTIFQTGQHFKCLHGLSRYFIRITIHISDHSLMKDSEMCFPVQSLQPYSTFIFTDQSSCLLFRNLKFLWHDSESDFIRTRPSSTPTTSISLCVVSSSLEFQVPRDTPMRTLHGYITPHNSSSVFTHGILIWYQLSSK